MVVDGVTIGAFSELSGLTAEGDAIDHLKAANLQPTVRKLVGLHKYTNITLKRGYMRDQSLWNWRKGKSDRRDDSSDEREIERDLESFARSPNGGLIVTSGPATVGFRSRIVTLANQHKLPSIYYERLFAAEGGLLSYGPNLVDATRRMASYVDRIFKGEKPAELPVQVPNKYDLVVNLKTAKILGLAIPESFLLAPTVNIHR